MRAVLTRVPVPSTQIWLTAIHNSRSVISLPLLATQMVHIAACRKNTQNKINLTKIKDMGAVQVLIYRTKVVMTLYNEILRRHALFH